MFSEESASSSIAAANWLRSRWALLACERRLSVFDVILSDASAEFSASRQTNVQSRWTSPISALKSASRRLIVSRMLLGCSVRSCGACGSEVGGSGDGCVAGVLPMHSVRRKGSIGSTTYARDGLLL